MIAAIDISLSYAFERPLAELPAALRGGRRDIFAAADIDMAASFH